VTTFKLSKSLSVASLLAVAAVGLATAQTPDSMSNRSDARLIKEVRHELVMLPYYGVFDDLAYRVDGNNVTLFGAVTNPVLKTDAQRAVERIEGVGQVTNNIEVLPLSPMDNQTRRAVYRAIYGAGQLADRYAFQAVPSIHIIVKDGHVTLTGVVMNQMDKNIAGVQANSVPGVFSVTNNLVVQK
jgi:hyperosmotically inducible protein